VRAVVEQLSQRHKPITDSGERERERERRGSRQAGTAAGSSV